MLQDSIISLVLVSIFYQNLDENITLITCTENTKWEEYSKCDR